MAEDYTSQDDNDGSNLKTISKDGVVPKERIRDASSANALAVDRWHADLWAAADRAIIDDLVDGSPPCNTADLRANGQGNAINVNFQRAFAKEEQSLASYQDLALSDSSLINCEVNVGTLLQRQEWADVIAKEYTRLMRYRWPDFVPNYLMLAKGFIRTGVSIAFRPDGYDWRWSVSRLGNFQIDRREGCSVGDLELAIQRVEMTPPAVYDWIEDGDSARMAGWNTSATMEAIKNAHVRVFASDTYSWEQTQRDLKDNGLFLTKGKDPRVELRHFWVKEFDQSVSHLITSPDNDKDFLFKRKSRWDSMESAFTFFTYGIGNGDFYSIRGLGYKIFAIEQLFNLLMSRAGDSALRSMSYLWQPSSADAEQDANQIIWGADTIIPQGIAPILAQVQNLGNNAIPYMNMLANQESINTGTYTQGQQLIPGGQPDRKSATQSQIEAQQEAVLTTSAKVLFFQSLDRLDQMTMKALVRRDYPRNMPGGELRWEFIRRCRDQGVPMEALYTVDCVRHTRPVGMGSLVEQQQKLAAIAPIFQYLDKAAQQFIIRKTVDSTLGVDYGKILVPEKPKESPDKTAELEANSFVNGFQVERGEDENDMAHLAQHFPFIATALQAVEQGQIKPQDALTRVMPALANSAEHVEALGKTPGKAKEAKEAKQILQQFADEAKKLASSVAQQAQQEQQAMQKEQEAQSASQMEQQRLNAETQAAIARKQAESVAQIQIDQTEAEHRIMNDTAETQATIQSKQAHTETDVHAKAVKTAATVTAKDLETAQKIRNAPPAQ